MSTLTVELPDDLAARLDKASERRRLRPAELVRLYLPDPGWEIVR